MHRIDDSMYILRHANLITMEDDKVLYDMDMFVANGKIYKIAKHIDVSDIREKDMTGKFIMPGLFDCHIHMDADDITEMLIACGITTARNMWGLDETQQWIREIDQGMSRFRRGSLRFGEPSAVSGLRHQPENKYNR